MQKGKLLVGLAVIIVSLTMATAAFSQATITVASSPAARACNSDNSAVTGSITLTATTASGAALGGTFTVNFGLPVINVLNSAQVGIYGAAQSISVVGTSGFSVTTLAPVLSNAAGQIVLTLPTVAGLSANATIGTITITNVRVGLAGSGLTTLNASLSVAAGSTYQVQAGQNITSIIASIVQCVADPIVSTTSTVIGTDSKAGSSSSSAGARVLTSGAVTSPNFSVDVSEASIDGLQTAGELGNGALNDTNLLFTFQNLQAGMTISLVNASGAPSPGNGNCNSAWANATIATVLLSAGSVTTTFSNTSITSANNTLVVSISGPYNPSPTAIDTFRLCATVSVSSTTAVLPLALTNVTMTVQLAPNGLALGSGGVVISAAGTGLPRFAVTPQPSTPLTVVTIQAAETNLLIPSAYASAATGGDLAIHVANTTTDPFPASNAGTTKASPQNGLLTFYLFPQSGSSQTYTTSASSPGAGLTSGVLNSGGIYTVTLSQLLAALPTPLTSFTGYIIINCKFTNGHGNAFFTLNGFGSVFTAPVLVIGTGTRNLSPEVLGN